MKKSARLHSALPMIFQEFRQASDPKRSSEQKRRLSSMDKRPSFNIHHKQTHTRPLHHRDKSIRSHDSCCRSCGRCLGRQRSLPCPNNRRGPYLFLHILYNSPTDPLLHSPFALRFSYAPCIVYASWREIYAIFRSRAARAYC